MAAPLADGVSGFLPELPGALIATGRFSNVDFIGGHCTNDGRTFVGGAPSQFVTDEDIMNLLFDHWGSHIVSYHLLLFVDITHGCHLIL